jgi:hypothetical protein
LSLPLGRGRWIVPGLVIAVLIGVAVMAVIFAFTNGI